MSVVERYFTGQNRRTQKEIFPGDSLSFKNHMWNSVGSNSGPRNENPAIIACTKRKESELFQMGLFLDAVPSVWPIFWQFFSYFGQTSKYLSGCSLVLSSFYILCNLLYNCLEIVGLVRCSEISESTKIHFLMFSFQFSHNFR